MTSLMVDINESQASGGFPEGLPNAFCVQDGLRNMKAVSLRSSDGTALEELSTWFPYTSALSSIAISSEFETPTRQFKG